MRLSTRHLALLLSVAPALASCSGNSNADSAWFGKTYLLSVPADNWTKPRGVGSSIADFVPQFLIHVDGGSGGNLTVTVATAWNGAQDMCNPTTQVTTSGGNYPKVQIASDAFPARIVDTTNNIAVNTTVRGLTLTDVLPGDSPAKNGTLSATIDISELYPLFTQVPNRTKDSVCTALGQAGVACTACPQNGQPYCVALEAVELGATQTSTPLKPVAPGAVASSCSP